MKTAVCTISTYNFLHQTLTMIRSLRAAMPSAPKIYVLLVDRVEEPRPGFEGLEGVEFLTCEQAGVENIGWLRMKLPPNFLCFTAKSYCIEHALDEGYDQVLYADADLYFFSDPTWFIESHPEADLLVTPHLVDFQPNGDPWTRQNRGDIAFSGLLNAGIYLVRDRPGSRRFLRQLAEMNSGPGAFHVEFVGMLEQQNFNWCLTCLDKVGVVKDRRMNVGSWNLHERPIRWQSFDGGNPEVWTLEGEPITCFHFTAFDWRPSESLMAGRRGSLSRYDGRHQPALNANLFELCEFYARRLEENGRAFYADKRYAYSAYNGIAFDLDLRHSLQALERFQSFRSQSWEESVEETLARLATTSAVGSVMPNYVDRWRMAWPDFSGVIDSLYPRVFFEEMVGRLIQHPVFGVLYDRYTPFIYHRATLRIFAERLAEEASGLDPDAAERLILTSSRDLALGDTFPLSDELRGIFRVVPFRRAAFVPALAIRYIYDELAPLQSGYPDPLGADFEGFKAWLSSGFQEDFLVPASVAEFIERLDIDRSILLVFGRLQRLIQLLDPERTSDLERVHFVPLIGETHSKTSFDANDLVLVDWWYCSNPQRAKELFLSLFPKPVEDPKFSFYLAEWLRRRGWVSGEEARVAAEPLREPFAQQLGLLAGDNDGKTFEERQRKAIAAVAWPEDDVSGRFEAFLEPEPSGVNLFGYSASAHGLGAATRRLGQALEGGGFEVKQIALQSTSMAEEARAADLFLDFDFSFPRSLVITYPHIEYSLHELLPPAFFQGRETTACLAWEQRDFNRAWAKLLGPYDKLSAISDFAARSIAQGTGREVATLPAVVVTGEPLDKAEARAAFGIADEDFVAGYIFNAESSFVRKNPHAVVEAFEKAIAGRKDALLILKIGAAHRSDVRSRIKGLFDHLARSGIRYKVITDHLTDREVETLICALDVYLSLHRSEGFGYTLAEAMMLGVPCVASRYSGNLDFMNDRNAFLVDCREVVVDDPDGPFTRGTVWAQPDGDMAADILRKLFAERDSLAEMKARARQDVLAHASPEAVGRKARSLLLS